jgi:uncharacterized lipoprotein YajG
VTAAAQTARRALRRFVRDQKAFRAAAILGALVASIAFAGCGGPSSSPAALPPVPTPSASPTCAAPYYLTGQGGILYPECAAS